MKTQSTPYSYYLHRIRYRHYRRNGVPALLAWCMAIT